MYFIVVDVFITEAMSLRQPILGIQNLCFIFPNPESWKNFVWSTWNIQEKTTALSTDVGQLELHIK